MNKKVISSVVFVLALSICLGIFLSLRDSSSSPLTEEKNQTINNQPKTKNSTQQTEDGFTKSEVASHNTRNDCWTIISGSVYDITDYVQNHPGGNEISRACGIDASLLFQSRTTSSGEKIGSGTPHSNSAENILSEFEIGNVKQ